ncbi:hypothetical protein Poli38472_012549 [Pythium oligandrum]|uniref:FYVE-type domain-containing protein n=1 Tax=Pythium oligandrum TaxID=41045 RepID=A0A8K1CF16_PYTOL|nr:hypothetical protein Poli38472_012549 [Pythium oligandrum]|eukprot:TMW61358.1 hypothetical protein Poli38472_012549 [Pythium oligandrum]
MTRTPLSATIPTLKLSPSEQHSVIEEAAAVLEETLQLERNFLADPSALDKRQWKKVRGEGDFRIYQERRRSRIRRHTTTSGQAIDLGGVDWDETSSVDDSIYDGSIYSDSLAGSVASSSVQMRFAGFDMPSLDVADTPKTASMHSLSTSSSTSGGIVASMKDPHVPMILAAGTVDGLLEDVVFGSLAGDETSWRLRSAYMKDTFADARILSTILRPTEADPYRFLGIKWFKHERKGMLLGPIILKRDFLVTEATGLTRDEHGVPHGYYLIHNFRHPDLPELTDRKILRCNISQCYISRQVAPNKVHIFARGFVDPKGELLHSISVALAAEAMMSTVNTAETSYTKKLMWLMAQSQSVNSREQQLQHMEAMTARSCESCNKSARFMSANLAFCQVCGNCICSKCTVSRKLVVDITASGVSERQLPFCLSCVRIAMQLPPHQAAVDTVVRPHAS